MLTSYAQNVAHILCSFSHIIRSVFEELAEEGRRSYKKHLAEFDEKYPDWEELLPRRRRG